MKIKRTVSRELLAEVLKKGRVQHTPFFSVRAISSPTSACTAVISKKVAKTAVARNRAKRRIRDAVALVLAQSSQTHTVVVFVNKSIVEMSTFDLKQNISLALSKLLLVQ